ncbi:DUF3810 domain-containing protein [Nonlabens ponticola]|uniref:DUF3810 domain-containing protein n=1 Tax=Nonlabens ponticola TaxID=2496866 RepID=A0A3S9MYG6_9FLAO|nr:DUF3810 domain-containing protein [Nonlabens ponticola]AZQ44197.1 DUF3810 domain-containing protein [Nonlabens ponticola]
MKKSWVLILSFTSLAIQIIGYRILRSFPNFIETYYSTGIYPYIARAMRIGLGWLPFSFGDVVYVVGGLLMLRWLIVYRWELIAPLRLRSMQESRRAYRQARKRYTQLFLTANILLLFFHLAWGFNYYRQPLNKVLNIDADYTTAELQQVSQQLIATSNMLHSQLQQNDTLAVAFDRSQEELFDLAPSGFERIASVYPQLDYGQPSIKRSLLTWPLTYMGYSGYLNPITGEAHTNGNINNFKTPVLILHEMSHQLGFAKENEANFIAVITGMNHEDLYFQYSASIFALKYCLNDLYRRDPALYEELKPDIKRGVFKNWQELRDFWAPYDNNIIEQASQATYNTYLKANNQPDGMRTYSYVVALLVNHYK